MEGLTIKVFVIIRPEYQKFELLIIPYVETNSMQLDTLFIISRK